VAYVGVCALVYVRVYVCGFMCGVCVCVCVWVCVCVCVCVWVIAPNVLLVDADSLALANQAHSDCKSWVRVSLGIGRR
jgi:ABC-type transport system involved in Fe-S cluster assembly fused permease/ATPase subunit